MKNLTASMDKWTRLYTIIYVVFTFSMFAFINLSNLPEDASYIVVLVLLLAFLVSFLMVPKIFIQDRKIAVKNTFTNIKIPVDEIKSIEHYSIIGFNVRTMGVGGVFGFFGYFNWGEVWYVTNIYKKVKIAMHDQKVYMISVDQPEEFVAEINKLRHS